MNRLMQFGILAFLQRETHALDRKLVLLTAVPPVLRMR